MRRKQRGQMRAVMRRLDFEAKFEPASGSGEGGEDGDWGMAEFGKNFASSVAKGVGVGEEQRTTGSADDRKDVTSGGP